MPKRNYQFEKRQKDLAKKQKQEEKRLRKLDRSKRVSEDSPPLPATPDELSPPRSPGLLVEGQAHPYEQL